MAADIGVYNFSWKDMGVPTLFKMMDIVQVSMLVAKRALLRRTLTCCGHSQQRGAAMHSCYQMHTTANLYIIWHCSHCLFLPKAPLCSA